MNPIGRMVDFCKEINLFKQNIAYFLFLHGNSGKEWFFLLKKRKHGGTDCIFRGEFSY